MFYEDVKIKKYSFAGNWDPQQQLVLFIRRTSRVTVSGMGAIICICFLVSIVGVNTNGMGLLVLM